MKRDGFIACSTGAIAALSLLDSAAAGASPATPEFRFQSRFWTNLNHTLYYQAQVLQTVYEAGDRRLDPMDVGVLADVRAVATEDRHDWYQAIRIYQDNYTSQSFVFTDSLMQLDNALARATDEAPLASLGLPKPMAQALLLASPIYRRGQWQRDDAGNRTFIGAIRSNVERFGPELARRLAALYHTPWLQQPILVDVMPYAQAEGSYSNNADDFVHIAMSTTDADERGLSGLDILFHEASHSIADPQYGTIGSAITAAAANANRPAPSQFWHTVIMYAPGKLCERIFDRAGLGPYTMWPIREGLFTRVWPRYYDALERYFLPFIDGVGTLDAALTRCVDYIVTP